MSDAHAAAGGSAAGGGTAGGPAELAGGGAAGLAGLIDHTLLKADATRPQIERLCHEAREHGFASVCVNSCWVPLCRELLADSPVKVCTVVGFPLGAASPAAKAAEAAQAVADGADELDMVINVGWLLADEAEAVQADIAGVVSAAQGRCVKVIIETCLLSRNAIVRACELAVGAGATFVKTSTGFSTGGARAEDVALMASAVQGRCQVKAAGGIHTAAEARAMIAAGASRIGTSSGIGIIAE